MGKDDKLPVARDDSHAELKAARKALKAAQKAAARGKSDEKQEEEAEHAAKKYRHRWRRRATRFALNRVLKHYTGKSATGWAVHAAKHGVRALFSSPVFWIILFVALFIYILIMIFAAESAANNPDIQVTINKSGPEEVPNPDDSNRSNIRYTIDVSTDQPVDDIILYDTIPEGTKYVDASGEKELNTEDGKITSVVWSVTKNASESTEASDSAGLSGSFTLTVKPEQSDFWVMNIAGALAFGGEDEGGTSNGEYISPSSDNCSGKYNITSNPLHKNFGDPQCTFTKKKLFDLLMQLENQDRKRVNDWYVRIVPHESSYNPNAFFGGSPDSGGAWGLYQMGSSSPPGKPPPAPGLNGQYDRGDVNWEIQTENAVKYNQDCRKKGGDYWYWEAARNAGIAKPC